MLLIRENEVTLRDLSIIYGINIGIDSPLEEVISLILDYKQLAERNSYNDKE